jgi:NADP-dependent 3-hydroxy acid dehydrogenase YdfG
MVDAFRNEFRPLGIRVTSVMPGPTWSASWEGVEFPEERLLKAKHIADVVWSAWSLPVEAVIEEIVIRPFEGDIE